MEQKKKLSTYGNWIMYGDGRMRDGGSFLTALRDCFVKADGSNREKLISAFPEWFNELDITHSYSGAE